MSILYRKARFCLAVQHLDQLPDNFVYEVGFAGRSNAGKSSAINTITGIHSLARISKTPGRTQQIIYFGLDDIRAIVDLPGYGFAKVPLSVKAHWRELMEGYFQTRRQLKGLVMVMDIRHPMKEFDQQMLTWCHHSSVPAHVILTKSDKVSKNIAGSTLLSVTKELKSMGLENFDVQLFSSLKRTGSEIVIDKLDSWYELQPSSTSLESAS